MVRSKESTGDVGIVFVVVLLLLLRGPSRKVFDDDDDDDISGVNVSRTKGVSSPRDDAIFFVGIGLDLFFVAETTVAIKIAFASKHFSAWWWFCRGVIDTLDRGLAGKTISRARAFPPHPRTNPNGFFGATSSHDDVEGVVVVVVVVVVVPPLLKTNRSREELCNGASSTRASTIGRMMITWLVVSFPPLREE